jgi:hypothetical protein
MSYVIYAAVGNAVAVGNAAKTTAPHEQQNGSKNELIRM